LGSVLEDEDGRKGIFVEPEGGVDAIVSRSLEEVGQHILRVEVSYGCPVGTAASNTAPTQGTGSGKSSNSNNNSTNNTQTVANPNPRKTLRKFYRFAVSSPLHIRELTRRSSESSCIVSLAVENATGAASSAAGGGAGGGGTMAPSTSLAAAGGLTICRSEFQPFAGLDAVKVQSSATTSTPTSSGGGGGEGINKSKLTAVELYDTCGRLEAGSSTRTLFDVRNNGASTAVGGITTEGVIAGGDELGKAVVTWRKAMGEAGRIASTFVFCPPSRATLEPTTSINETDGVGVGGRRSQTAAQPTTIVSSSKNNHHQTTKQHAPFLIDGSGLSTDVTTSSTLQRPTTHSPSEIPNLPPLYTLYPITVTPIDPPRHMIVDRPIRIRCLVVNHSPKPVSHLQVQFRLPLMKGVVVTGPSFMNLGTLGGGSGGSAVVVVTLVAMVPGLFFVGGCFVVNLGSGMAVKQPALFSVFVDGGSGDGVDSGDGEGGSGDALYDLA